MCTMHDYCVMSILGVVCCIMCYGLCARTHLFKAHDVAVERVGHVWHTYNIHISLTFYPLVQCIACVLFLVDSFSCERASLPCAAWAGSHKGKSGRKKVGIRGPFRGVRNPKYCKLYGTLRHLATYITRWSTRSDHERRALPKRADISLSLSLI